MWILIGRISGKIYRKEDTKRAIIFYLNHAFKSNDHQYLLYEDYYFYNTLPEPMQILNVKNEEIKKQVLELFSKDRAAFLNEILFCK